ncbi:MAG: protein jag [Actinobacteria bacterium]|nr:protein jag [Actinomycetota bacterium]
MQVIEKTGRTVEEAVEQAIAELGIPREETDIEIIEQPSKGFLGLLGSKPARVKVSVRNSPVRRVKGIMTDILNTMDLQARLDIVEKDNTVTINLEGENLGILIGRRGETLDALQYLVNLSINKNQENRKKFILDIEGYRTRREDTLKKLAHKLADKAMQRGRNVVLEPMNSLERRIIHTALQGRDDISTFSEGEEPYRKIIISPKR